MIDPDDFQKRLSAALEPVREQIREEQDADKRQVQEAHRLKVEAQEKLAKVRGVQIRFREKFIKPCYQAIQREISGGLGNEHDEPQVGWSYHFDYEKGRIELLIEYGDSCFRIVARAYIDNQLAHSESTEFPEDKFDPDEAGKWLQHQAIECAKVSLKHSQHRSNPVVFNTEPA